MSHLRTLAPLGFGLGLALVLAGCSGGGTTNEPAAAATGVPSDGASAAPAPEGTAGTRTNPGVSGKIAYVSGQLMQVQDSDSQTAVAWGDTTTITSQVSGTLADVVAGVCITATSAATTTDGTSTAAPSADATASGPATQVAITDPVDGACTTTGFGGSGGFPGGGTFSGGTPGQMPSGMATAMPGGDGGQGGQVPGDLPSGFPTDGTFGGGARAFGARTSGLVTAVDASTITVQTTAQDGTTSTATATVDASTTYTKTVTADASAIVVGQCASAFGESDSSGKITATSITVSAPTDGTCSSFGTGRGTGLMGSRSGSGGEGSRDRGNDGSSTSTQGGTNA